MQTDLLPKLRDCFMEVIQRGQTHPDPNTGTGLFLSLSNIEELSLIVSSLCLVWSAHPPLDTDTQKKLRLLRDNRRQWESTELKVVRFARRLGLL